MKKFNLLFLQFFVFGFLGISFSQVGIGTLAPDPAAMLHIETPNKGLLPPRITTAGRDTIPTPIPEGLVIYNTTTSTLQLFSNGTWNNLNTAASCNFIIFPSTIDLNIDKGQQKSFTINFQTTLGTPGEISTSLFSSTSGFDITADNITNNNVSEPGSQEISVTLQNTTSANVGDTGQVFFQVTSECGKTEFITLNLTITGCDFSVTPQPNQVFITKPTSGTNRGNVSFEVLQTGTISGNIDFNLTSIPSGFTHTKSNTPCSYDCFPSLEIEIDNTVTEGNYTIPIDFTSDCGQTSSLNITVSVEPFPTDCNQIIGENPSATDGVYVIDPDGTFGSLPSFNAYCDMTTDGGGWTLVLNYNHLASTDPNTQIRTNSLPVLGSTSLGVDESNTPFWGHASNALMNELNFSEVRFFGRSSSHARILHFKEDQQAMIDYFKTGTGGVDLTDLRGGFIPFNDHDARNPLFSNRRSTNRGENAMLDRPFFTNSGGTNDWRINQGNDWEMDDNPSNQSNNTIHQIWVR